jgi:uncharacterized protein DUF5916/cellulose/xylan binding protein with CBM9 domain
MNRRARRETAAMEKSMKSRIVVFVLLCLASLRAAAQEQPPAAGGETGPPPPPTYSVASVRLLAAPVIDGKLDDAVWQQAVTLGGFTQDFPDEGLPPTEKTEVRVGYDEKNLYFGVRCYDSQPDKIVAPLLSRDGDLTYEDSIWIVLDTFHDRRNGFLFATNPLGVQVDGLVRNEGEGQSLEWDGLWTVATSRDPQGWQAEFAIPFKTLRYSAKDPQVWGFNVWRYLSRRKEESAWRPVRQEWGYLARFKISQYGELHGLQDLATGGRFSFIPYTLGRNRDGDREPSSTQGEIGGDFKISLTSELVADLTYNTDFAEAEADQQQVNLTRFKLYYPEQRQFFLEGANLFYFGDRITPYDPPEPFVFFFSRQIGLADDGRVEVPVVGGAKVAGQIGSTSVGVLSMATDPASFVDSAGNFVDEPRTNFSVVRLKQRIYPKSTIGLIALNKDPSGAGYNRGFGMDWDLAMGSRLSSTGFVARTQSPGVHGDDKAYSADLIYQGPKMRLGETYTEFGEDFNPEMGFITRAGIDKSTTEASWILTPDKLVFHQLFLVNSFDHIADRQGNLQSQLLKNEIGFTARNRAGLAFIRYSQVEVLEEPLEIHKGVVLPVGDYHFDHYFLGFASDYSRRYGVTLWYDRGQFYDGDRLRTLVAFIAKPIDGLVADFRWDRNDVTLEEGDFITDLVSGAVDYAWSTRWATRLTLQYSKEDALQANLLLDWSYRPGSHLYLVYDGLRDLDALRRAQQLSSLNSGRSITLKLTQRMDF